MTTSQRNHLFCELWPQAARTQGWNVSDRAKRMEVLTKILGRPIQSANEISNKEDYDTVKRELVFLADNLKATIETLNPSEATARRLRKTIREYYLPCLGVYHPKPAGYLQKVIYDKFQVSWNTGIDELTAIPTDNADGPGKGPSQLQQVIMALARGIQMRRSKAGDTLHEMHRKANVFCSCALCKKNRTTPQESDLAGESESVPMTAETGNPF
jgi:hypothetical protein